MKSISSLFLLPLFFLYSAPALAQGKKLVLINDTYAPFVLEAKKQPGPGLDIEIAVEALKTEGYEVEVKLVGWSRVLKSLKDGEADFTTTLSKKPDREEFIDWSDSYRSRTDYGFYASSDAKFEFKSLDDLNNKKLGTTKDFTYPEEITKGKKVTEETSDNIANTFSKLEKNRFDLLIMNSFVADFYIKDANLSRKIKKFDFKYSNDGHVFMGFSKKKKLTDAIAAFNKGFAAITKSGKLKELELKYGSK